MKICVIGAGLSGLVTIKELKEEGHEVVCYEQGAETGGVFRPNDGKNPAYDAMSLTVSNYFMAFSSLPPEEPERRYWTKAEYTVTSMKLAPLVDKLTFGRLGRALANRRPAPSELLKQMLNQKTLPPTATVRSLCPNGRAWHHLKYKLHKVYQLNPKTVQEGLTVAQLVDLCADAQPLSGARTTTAATQPVADHA